MNAAVVRSFTEPPASGAFDIPPPSTPDEMLVDVCAAALHPRTRSSAEGSHYTSTGQLPMIPGLDGVGRDPERLAALTDYLWGPTGQRIVFVP